MAGTEMILESWIVEIVIGGRLAEILGIVRMWLEVKMEHENIPDHSQGHYCGVQDDMSPDKDPRQKDQDPVASSTWALPGRTGGGNWRNVWRMKIPNLSGNETHEGGGSPGAYCWTSSGC